MTAAPTTGPAAELLALGTATVYEASKLWCFLPHRISAAWPGAAVAGRALPVRAAPGDNLALHRALEHARAGDVLVVDAGGQAYGYWGEVLTVAAQYRGVAGLVIDGGVRDVDRLRELRFPTFSSSVTVRTTVKEWPGTVGEPIRIGGVRIDHGDPVLADADGVVILPAADAEGILSAARQRAEDERRYLERIRAGSSTLDIYSLRSKLAPRPQVRPDRHQPDTDEENP
jgi:4-hydroxy-4-methyl-2-oxoglutarate aldolase